MPQQVIPSGTGWPCIVAEFMSYITQLNSRLKNKTQGCIDARKVAAQLTFRYNKAALESTSAALLYLNVNQ